MGVKKRQRRRYYRKELETWDISDDFGDVQYQYVNLETYRFALKYSRVSFNNIFTQSHARSIKYFCQSRTLSLKETSRYISTDRNNPLSNNNIIGWPLCSYSTFWGAFIRQYKYFTMR